MDTMNELGSDQSSLKSMGKQEMEHKLVPTWKRMFSVHVHGR